MSKSDIVNLLMSAKSNIMSLTDMSKTLTIDEHLIQTHISQINHSRKAWPTVQIHRTGKKGSSFYELQTSQTKLDTIIKTSDKHAKSAVNHVKVNHDIDLLTIANAQAQSQRLQLVTLLSNRKNNMVQKIMAAA